MTNDLTDRTLDAWQQAQPDLETAGLQVTARLSRIGPLLARRQEGVFERFGLGRGEVGVLGALRIAGQPYQLSPTRMAKGLMLSSAGITSRIDRLERRGFVRRLPDPDDRRGVIIELTDEGRRLWDEAVGAQAEKEAVVGLALTLEERDELNDLLRRLMHVFEAEHGPVRKGE